MNKTITITDDIIFACPSFDGEGDFIVTDIRHAIADHIAETGEVPAGVEYETPYGDIKMHDVTEQDIAVAFDIIEVNGL